MLESRDAAPMSPAALFIATERWTQPDHLWTDGRINTKQYAHTRELLKRKDPTRAIPQTNPEDVRLGDRSQSQKKKYCVIPLVSETDSRRIHRGGKQNGGWQEELGVTIYKLQSPSLQHGNGSEHGPCSWLHGKGMYLMSPSCHF